MDTRNKILTPAEAEVVARRMEERGDALTVVTGYFDPLVAEHARRLGRRRQGAGALMVVVATPERPILPAGARAELVAALSVVDYVVLPGKNGVEEVLARLGAKEMARDEAADEKLTRGLIDHVRSRQQAI